jgi:hypothetical protein
VRMVPGGVSVLVVCLGWLSRPANTAVVVVKSHCLSVSWRAGARFCLICLCGEVH